MTGHITAPHTLPKINLWIYILYICVCVYIYIYKLMQYIFKESSIIYAEEGKEGILEENITTFLMYPGKLSLQSWVTNFWRFLLSDFTSSSPWIDTARGIPFCYTYPYAAANQFIAHSCISLGVNLLKDRHLKKRLWILSPWPDPLWNIGETITTVNSMSNH